MIPMNDETKTEIIGYIKLNVKITVEDPHRDVVKEFMEKEADDAGKDQG